ncbi:MAG: DNA adenine methylase [Chloroflexales bacterium]
MRDRLELRYVPLGTLLRWDRNHKRHDLGALAASIARHGFRDPPAYDAALNGGEGGVVEGNGRGEVLTLMQAQGQPVPRGIIAEGADWLVPVLFGLDSASQAAAESYAVDHNNLTMSGADFTDLDMAKLWEPEGYAALLADLATQGMPPITIDETALDALLTALRAEEPVAGHGGDSGSVEDVEPDEAGDVPDLVAPFPWFGGKARVASRIWARFGDVQNYVEPFCGSAAVLLAAPEPPKIATLNDADGFVANFWRALLAEPDAVATHLDWPVNEIDLFARHVWLVKRSGELRTRLEAEPDYYDTKIAGWWCWGACAWIGTGWCSGEGPWSVEDGQVVNIRGNAGRGVNRKLPELWGRGVHKASISDGDEDGGMCAAVTRNLHTYMHRLADALRTARVTCGDWSRVVTPSCTTRHGITAVLLDPPYGEGEQEYSAGGNQDKGIAADVWRWACENGNDPLFRIAVCGYEDGRDVPPGWSVLRWHARKGYASTEEARENSRRECIWFSPHCLPGSA